jgi:metal-dependent amidase/aminoacylase/carboxypeptidase family protein
VQVQTKYLRGVPPVLNSAVAVEAQTAAIVAALGPAALAETNQSMGGEDFAWYLDTIPGALARLGVRRPGGRSFDLHQGTFDIDEDALAIGVRYTVELARSSLADLSRR